MTEQMVTVFSNQAGIATHVCLRGHEYLQVGHVCLTLRKSYGQPAQYLLAGHPASPQEDDTNDNWQCWQNRHSEGESPPTESANVEPITISD
jgi:hypothetical protein